MKSDMNLEEKRRIVTLGGKTGKVGKQATSMAVHSQYDSVSKDIFTLKGKFIRYSCSHTMHF